MKIKVSYILKVEEELDVTPEELWAIYKRTARGDAILPKERTCQKLYFNEEVKEEFDKWWKLTHCKGGK